MIKKTEMVLCVGDEAVDISYQVIILESTGSSSHTRGLYAAPAAIYHTTPDDDYYYTTDLDDWLVYITGNGGTTLLDDEISTAEYIIDEMGHSKETIIDALQRTMSANSQIRPESLEWAINQFSLCD